MVSDFARRPAETSASSLCLGESSICKAYCNVSPRELGHEPAAFHYFLRDSTAGAHLLRRLIRCKRRFMGLTSTSSASYEFAIRKQRAVAGRIGTYYSLSESVNGWQYDCPWKNGRCQERPTTGKDRSNSEEPAMQTLVSKLRFSLIAMLCCLVSY